MSESETKGRCRSEVDECRGSPSELKIADAIDRLAADVAAIKEAVCDGSVAEERDRFLAGMGSAIKERDAAIRQRDEARAEAQRIQDEADDQEQTDKVKRLNAEIEKMHYTLMNRTWERDEARAEVERLTARLGDRAKVQQTQLSAAFTEGTLQAGDAMRARFEQVEKERDEARAEVERLRMQLAACGVLADCNTTDSLERNRRMHPDYDCASVQSVIRAVEREIGLLAEVERLRGELAARPAANSPGISDSSPAASQPAAPAAGWLTEEVRKVIILADSELSAIGHHRPPDKEQCLRLSADLRRLWKEVPRE